MIKVNKLREPKELINLLNKYFIFKSLFINSQNQTKRTFYVKTMKFTKE